MKTAPLIAATAALGLSACADYTYVYDYGPGGPRGHYVGPYEHPAPAQAPCARYVMAGPYEDGYRGPYYTGPYCAEPAPAATAG